MTRTDLFEAAAERYQQLKDKLSSSKDASEKNQVRHEMLSLMDVILYIFERLKYLD